MAEEKRTFKVVGPDGELKKWEIEMPKMEMKLMENKPEERQAISKNIFFGWGRWIGRLIIGLFNWFFGDSNKAKERRLSGEKQKLLELEGKLKWDEFDKYVDLAIKALRNNLLEEALSYFDQALAREPQKNLGRSWIKSWWRGSNLEWVWHNKAIILKKLGRYEEGLQCCERVLILETNKKVLDLKQSIVELMQQKRLREQREKGRRLKIVGKKAELVVNLKKIESTAYEERDSRKSMKAVIKVSELNGLRVTFSSYRFLGWYGDVFGDQMFGAQTQRKKFDVRFDLDLNNTWVSAHATQAELSLCLDSLAGVIDKCRMIEIGLFGKDENGNNHEFLLDFVRTSGDIYTYDQQGRKRVELFR